ncbi:MAG: hypothetical protein KGL59_15500 [Acidobacteriota bacterium]|nr:hypothetical protein [Acidobacteriota bacterium]
MSWLDQVGKFLKHQSSAGAAAAPAPDVNAVFDQVAKEAPPSVIAEGLAEAFRSKQGPGFSAMLTKLFSNSNPDQKTGMLNEFLSSMRPDVLTRVLTGAGVAGIVGKPGAKFTPEQAQTIAPETVRELATQAEKANPAIVDSFSNFYARHAALVKTLGPSILTIALTKIAQRQKAA